MSTKTKSVNDQSMTYDDRPFTDTQDSIAARAAANDNTPSDPSIPFYAARQKSNLARTLGNQFGANVAPETFAAMKYAREADIDQNTGQRMAEDAWRRREAKFGRLYNMAQLTAPHIVQTGGHSQGTVSQSPNWMGLATGAIGAFA